MKTIVSFDGQNLYHSAKNAWAPVPAVPGSPYGYPSYDVEKLAQILVARVPGRVLSEIRFYTGVPNPKDGRNQAFWHGFWNNKLRYLGSRGIYTYRGRINPGGQEKGVDVTLAVDLVELAYDRAYDAAIIVSQDWDFGSAVRLCRRVAQNQGRAIAFDSASPIARVRYPQEAFRLRLGSISTSRCMTPASTRRTIDPETDPLPPAAFA